MADPPALPKKKFINIRRNKSMDYKGVMPDSINIKKLIETGNLEGLKHILDKEKTALHSTDAESQTLLHYACEFGQPEIAKYLLDKGLDVNAINKFGWTPMILAVCHGHLRVAQELCQQDDIDMSPKIPNSSRNVLHFLGRYWDPEIIPNLLRKCSKEVINAKDHFGDSPLHRVCIHCNAECAKALVLAGADVNLQNSQGETPLHYASRAGLVDIVELLLANGADSSVKGKYGTYQDVANSSSSITSPANEELERPLSRTGSAPVTSYAALVSPPLTPTPSRTPSSPSFSPPPTLSPPPASTLAVPSTENASPIVSPNSAENSNASANSNGDGSSSNSAEPVAEAPNAQEENASKPASASEPAASPAPAVAPPAPAHTQSSVSQAIGAMGTAVGAAIGNAVGGGGQNFSVRGTVKKLVEGILSSDMEIPGFDTKKLFQKMVYLTNFKDVLVREIVPQLKTKLLTTTFPAISGATDTPIGEIQYEVWKISLSSLSLDDKSISCEPKLEGLKIFMKMSAVLKHIHFKYSTHIMKDEGTATAEVQNLSCVFTLGVDLVNKQPKLTIKDTTVEMENLNLEIHKAKAKWLYNTIFGIISNKVKHQIAQLLTTTLSQQLAVLEGMFNDKLSLLWNKMRKKRKKKAKDPDTALITAQTATNLVLSEEILRIKAEIAKTKLEVLKLQLPAPKGNEIKCYYYQITSPSSPIIILVDMQSMNSLSELQRFIINEYQSLDSTLFPSRSSLSQVKSNIKNILKNNVSITPVSTSPPSASEQLLGGPKPEVAISGPNSDLGPSSDPIPEPLITSPSEHQLTFSSSSSSPSISIPIPVKFDLNKKDKNAKRGVDWKFKDNEGDFVSIAKHNTIEHIRKHARSLHIFERRFSDG